MEASEHPNWFLFSSLCSCGMGVGIKNFKDGVNGINEEIKKDVNKAEEADKKEDK